MDFLDRLFPLELRERKMQEFINLHQVGMCVKEYSLKFTQLSKYAPTMVADSRAKINKFVMEISDLVVNEYRLELIPIMDVSHVMVHAEQIEEHNLKQVGRELKKVRTKDENSSKAKFEVQDKPSFKRRFSNKALLMLPGSTIVRCLLLIPKRAKVVDLIFRSLFVQKVIRNMMVSA